MDRTRMAKKAVCRWLAANLEPGKSSNVDLLDLVDRWNDHANSDLAGFQISNARLVSYLEEVFRGASLDEKTNRINGVNWRKPKEIKWVERPSKSPEDRALELRLLAFLRDGSVFIARGEQGFATSTFAGFRQSWLMEGGARIVHDSIDRNEAEEFLKRCEMVRYDEGRHLWFVTN